MIKFTLEPSTPIITVDIGSKCVTCGTHTQPNALLVVVADRTNHGVLPQGTYTFTTIEAEAEGSITYTAGSGRWEHPVDVVTLKGTKCGPCQLVEFKLKQEEN